MIFEGFSDVRSLTFFFGNGAVPYSRDLSPFSKKLLSSPSTPKIKTGGAVGLEYDGLLNCLPVVISL